MRCEDFDHRLDALLDGTCTAGEWQEAEEHRKACPRCGPLFEALAGRGDSLDETRQATLVADVLARTSGAACETATERLCDYVDDVLPAFDRELVDAHLGHCPSCRALAQALARSTEILPSLAEVRAPESLAPRVFAETSRKVAPPHGLAARIGATLERLAARPRFSLEVAYVCTLVLLVLVGDPVKAVQRAFLRGAAAVEPGVVAAAQHLDEPLYAARALGERTAGVVSSVKSSMKKQARDSSWWDGQVASLAGWWETRVAGPVRTAMGQVSSWYQTIVQKLRRAFGRQPGEQPAGAAAERTTEPSSASVRSSC